MVKVRAKNSGKDPSCAVFYTSLFFLVHFCCYEYCIFITLGIIIEFFVYKRLFFLWKHLNNMR